jgi:hypothetical protein
MKKLILSILVLTVISFVSCKTEKQSGYNCNSGNCTAVFENPQYLTLADCQSACSSSSSAGYNCVSSNCVSVSSNAQYSTLSACQSVCGGSSGGYNCNSGNCVSVSNGAQYSTLNACQSACGVSSIGTVQITATWTTTYVYCNLAYTVVIGLGYTSTDVANEAYFAQSGGYVNSPVTYTNSSLASGTYYYKAKKTYNANTCGTGQGIPPIVIKSGAFTITDGQTTTVNAGSLN